jgi:hypothetical protein
MTVPDGEPYVKVDAAATPYARTAFDVISGSTGTAPVGRPPARALGTLDPMSIKTYGRRPLLRTLFRWFVTAAAVLAFAQAALAGAFLNGHYGALNLHSINASLTALATLGMVVVGVLIWRPGRGAAWPALISLGVLAAEVLQITLGFARSLSMHVPLGVAIIAGLIVLTLRVWRPEEPRVASAAVDAAPTVAAVPKAQRP